MSLMILGTASHVGKSTVVAAICRLLSDRGCSVAPYKSQNMSLNSYVTRDGAEIGIAQAMQAFAARVEPRAEMNPILLKPKGDRSSQIVLMGRPYRDVAIADYYRETDALLERALEAYDRLAADHDCIVVEGAGGAAEVNLYGRDIANMRLAERLGLPIVLVADIERGGVFAQVCGTIALLPAPIRKLVRGVIVNKFRGDPELFEDGVAILEALSGVPVLGVLPYAELDLPSEDSLSIGDKQRRDHPVRIAVLRFPRISNFTDFEALERRAAVDYVRPGVSLAGYDCVILPGTKNTMEDLAHLHASGGAGEVVRARAAGVPDPRHLRRVPDARAAGRGRRGRGPRRHPAGARSASGRHPLCRVREDDASVRTDGRAGRADPVADGDGHGIRDPHGRDRPRSGRPARVRR